jgi:hypothetical protein
MPVKEEEDHTAAVAHLLMPISVLTGVFIYYLAVM